MSIAEVVEKTENFSATPLAAIPDGIKSYKYYINDNSRNNTTKEPILYKDDRGAWRGSSHNALYLKHSSKQQLQKLLYLIKIKKLTQVLKQFLPNLVIKTSYRCISIIVIRKVTKTTKGGLL